MQDNDISSMKRRELKFRNYRPQDASLHSGVKKNTNMIVEGNVEINTSNQDGNKEVKDPVEGEVATGTVSAGNKSEGKKNVGSAPVDIIKRELELNQSEELNIVPKKPNWDLKNQIAQSLSKLDRRTQRAIVDLLREKVELEQKTDSEAEDE